jgi:hypothetical protein
MRRLTLAALALLFVTRTTAAQPRSAPSARSPEGTAEGGALAQPAARAADLRDVFAAGFLLEDRNRDSHIDFVPARFVLPARPQSAAVAAATNLAARLGYETSALNPGLVSTTASGDAPVVVVGDPSSPGAADLGPAQGGLTFLSPDSARMRGGIAVDGADATGLLAISGYTSGRYPSVWSTRGMTWTDVVQRYSRYLEQEGAPATVRLVRLVVQDRRPGIARAVLHVQVGDASQVDRVAGVLARVDSLMRDTTRARVVNTPNDSGRPRVRAQDLAIPDIHRVDLRLEGGASQRVVHLLPPRPWSPSAGAAATFRDAPDFTLSDLFTIRGLFRDTNQDLVPDRADIALSLGTGSAPRSLVDLGARLGLETAGIRLPLADVDRQLDELPDLGFPVVVGEDHYQVARLYRDSLIHVSRGLRGPGLGFMEFVRNGINRRNGLVLTGTDAAGVDAITAHAAQRLPYVWDHGKGEFELATIERDVRRFVQGRGTAGQVALAVTKARQWLERLRGRDLDSLSIEVVSEERPTGLDAFLTRDLRRAFPTARGSATTFQSGFGVGQEVIREDVEIPWEVDELRRAFRAALPRLSPTSRGRIDVRLSEPPEVRARLTTEITAALRERGIPAGAFDVSVLSAYKQGYSWLNDRVLPLLRDRGVARIELSYHTLKDSREVRWQEIESDTRWLQELYPIDAILARDLGLPDSAITFVPTRDRAPIYSVRATDASGKVILEQSFDPTYVVRPFFDLFPEYERIRVTTGWLTIEANGTSVVNQRIRTDPEAFWDHFQQVTYKKLIDYTMDIQDGRPSPAHAPYFDELRVDLTMSEPNYRIGIDEEVISSLEALHEDIYFETLTLFTLLGNRYGVGDMAFPGRILPWIQPGGDGKPGRARISVTGKTRGVPEVVLVSRERGGAVNRQRYQLDPLPVDPPRLRGIAVNAGTTDIARLLFEVAALDTVDRFAALKARGSESGIDRSFAPTPLVTGMFGALADLHAAGLLEQELSYDRVRELFIRVAQRDTLVRHQAFATVPRSRRPQSTTTPRLRDRTFAYTGQPLVQWDAPIPPDESDRVMARLATFPNVSVYHVGASFLGQDMFAADFQPASASRYVSQAKLNALKPTLVISGRQHANEVSSTSHILRFGELLATDSTYRQLLDKVNVVLHPITNADGARLAVDMQRTNPDFMLHAGYLGALGVDVTAGATNPDGIYPESRIRPRLMDTWLPDVFVNMHGYPTHEWVQYFAGYSAWVRSRQGAQRSWWAPRGWFIPGYSWVDDPRYPDLKVAQFAVLDSIAASITRLPAMEAINRRMYARYRKYGQQDVDNFREYFHNGMLVSLALRGAREATGTGVNNPRINYINITTEAPDETARDAWLRTVAEAGVAHSTALLRYLAGGVNDVRRESVEYDGYVARSVFRRKPVVPPPSATPPLR